MSEVDKLENLSKALGKFSDAFYEAFDNVPKFEDIVGKPKSFDGLKKKERRELAKKILKEKYPKIWKAFEEVGELATAISEVSSEMEDKVSELEESIEDIRNRIEEVESMKQEVQSEADAL